MFFIVGLGNPGQRYSKTRHNIGFQIIDKFQKENNFPEFQLSKKHKILISEGIFKGEKTILVKPQTFMNLSGKATKLLIENRRAKTKDKLKIENLIIIHDDIDLPLGKIKINKNRGSGGHKGVQSVIDELKTKNFIRFRIGIKPNSKVKIQKLDEFVLKNFSKKNEEKIVKEVIEKTVGAIEMAVKEGIEKTMTEYN